MPVWISAALVALFHVVMQRTVFGRYLYAIGDNERAARLCGVNVEGIKWLAYTLGGGLAGVAGLLMAARLDSATPNAGFSYELDSIAAVVIGGTSLSGGRGSHPGHGARLPDYRRAQQRAGAAGSVALLAAGDQRRRHSCRSCRRSSQPTRR